jgi:hypothetical protein
MSMILRMKEEKDRARRRPNKRDLVVRRLG